MKKLTTLFAAAAVFTLSAISTAKAEQPNYIVEVLYQTDTAYQSFTEWRPVFHAAEQSEAGKALNRVRAILADGPVVTSDVVWWSFTEKATRVRLVKKEAGKTEGGIDPWKLIAALEQN